MNLSKLFLMSNFVTSQAFFKPPVIKPPFNQPKPIQSNNGGLDCNGLGCELVRTTDHPNSLDSRIGISNQVSNINPDNGSVNKNYLNGPGQELVKPPGKQSDKKITQLASMRTASCCKNFEEAVKKQ